MPVIHGASLGLNVKGQVESLSFDYKPENDGKCTILQALILHLLIPIPR